MLLRDADECDCSLNDCHTDIVYAAVDKLLLDQSVPMRSVNAVKNVSLSRSQHEIEQAIPFPL